MSQEYYNIINQNLDSSFQIAKDNMIKELEKFIQYKETEYVQQAETHPNFEHEVFKAKCEKSILIQLKNKLTDASSVTVLNEIL